VLARPFELAGESVSIGASIGIALYPADAGSFDGLLRDAGLALRRAKDESRGSFRFFEAGTDERIRERQQLELDLRSALAHDELELHYQGLFDGGRLDVMGYEALLRWTHPTRGRISPAEFIPIAEGCGIIRQLGQWVLETACREAAGWPQALRVSVNLSPAQFKGADLPQRVIETLARTGLAPERLELEVTEGVLIDDAERALAVLSAIKAHGVRLALDDFGTGYSSLSYLRRFPFDTLKLDKSFVQAIGQTAESDAIVRAVIGLGHSLNLDVVAEGVETPPQLAFLRAQNCHLLQGFLLARPTPATALQHAAPERARA
jgi:diguanylate cyclase